MKAILVFCVCGLLLVSCGQKGDSKGSQEESSGKEGGSEQAAKGGESKSTVKIDGEAQKKGGIQVSLVNPRAMEKYFDAAGQLVMNEDRTSHIGTYTDGRVTQVYVNVGDFVHKGMVLARMHSHDVHETRAAYQTALQDVQRQRSALRYQEQTRDRMGRLYALKSASKQEVDKADTDVRSAQTDLANAETAVQKEVAHLTDILHLSASSLANIDETTEQVPVIAPASGTVVNRMITPGAVVEPGQEVFTVSDLSSVWMMASLIEADISKVHTGQRVRVLVQAYPDQPFEGMVQRAGPQLDTTTRTLQVRVVIPNAGQKLRPGMYSTAQIDEGESTPALFVPEEAIQDVNGGSMVFVRTKPGVFEARAVQIAQRVRGEAQISQGLKPGEAVVFKGAFVLKSEMLKSQIGE